MEIQRRALTSSGLASCFVFQPARAELRPLLTVSIAEFLVAGFLNVSCAALAAVFTPCDVAILLSKSGRDVKYLDMNQGMSTLDQIRKINRFLNSSRRPKNASFSCAVNCEKTIALLSLQCCSGSW
jgi:hypothetical protein